MKAIKRMCKKSLIIDIGTKIDFKIIKGKEYSTSELREDGTVVLFSTYWVRVPVKYFDMTTNEH